MGITTKILLAVVLVAIIAVGAIVFSKGGAKSSSTSSTATTSSASSATITYDSNGFSPSEVSVASGGSVTITNKSSSEVEPASDPHPTHTNNPELNNGPVAAGKSETFTLTTTGTWGYHNHLNKDQHGTITVN